MRELVAHGRVLSNEQLEEVRDRLTGIVLQTFELRPMPLSGMTEKELQDRLEVTVEIWNHLYGECRWSKDRALDHILSLLLATIDGAKLQDRLPEPASDVKAETNSMWAPEKLQEAEAERRLSALAVSESGMIQKEKSSQGDSQNGGEL